ncbi:STAS domain-containing protein [Salipaludibacillus neizhouensis]|uniref:STAS domain-containing protein n=1 Tax=Salipaludibacillus neizhouensis TaxID=885475 RepID=UPI003908BB4F
MFIDSFDFNEDVDKVIIDVSEAQLWDDSAVGAMDKAESKFEQRGIKVEIRGLDKQSSILMDKIGGLSKASGH